jgi:hypothetical protein
VCGAFDFGSRLTQPGEVVHEVVRGPSVAEPAVTAGDRTTESGGAVPADYDPRGPLILVRAAAAFRALEIAGTDSEQQPAPLSTSRLAACFARNSRLR